MQVDRHGDVFVAGGFRTGYLAKLTGVSGELLWEHHASSGHLADVKIDPRGNVFVAGSAAGIIVTAKHAGADGRLIWEKRHVSGHASALALDHRGNVVVTGSTTSAGGAGYSFHTAKYAGANGRLVWERSYHDPRGLLDFALAVAVDRKGNVVVAGNVESQGDESNDMDFYTAKYAAGDGRILWEQTYDSPINGNDRVSAMALDARGNVTVAGYAAGIRYDRDLFIYDFYTTQYDGQTGKVRWEQQYDSEAHGDDRLAAFALGPNGEVAVTGYGSSAASGADYVTVLYRPKKLHQGSLKNPGKKPDEKRKDSK